MSRTPSTRFGGFLLIVVAVTAAACGGAGDTGAGSAPGTEVGGQDPLDCPDDGRMVTMVEPPPDTFAGFATPDEAVLAIASSLSISGELRFLDGDRWIMEDEAGRAVAVVSVGPWANDRWVARELTACEEQAAGQPGPAPDDVVHIPFRALADALAVGAPWTTRLISSPEELSTLVVGAEVDWEQEVVFMFTLAESGSCPNGPLVRMEYSATSARLYPLVEVTDQSGDCTSDANPRSIIVAIPRHALPTGAFSIWVEGGDPPEGGTVGPTFFSAGELLGSEAERPSP